MSKLLAIALTVLLMAAAFFLPAQLSQWNDQLLLDEPHIFQEKEREGFARSVGLTVAEKVLLLRSMAQTEANGMRLDAGYVTGLLIFSVDEEGVLERTVERGEFLMDTPEDSAGEFLALWDQRLTAVWGEIRALQNMGGLPELWNGETELEYNGSGETIYVDLDTGMSFRVYCITLSGAPYSLELRVDAQSGQVLSFSLYWTRDGAPSWGVLGASSFGGAWRDYWGMDSVNATWYNEYTRSILEETEARMRVNGEYNAVGDVSYAYGGQRAHIPLRCWAYKSQCSLHWNQ